MQGQSLDLALGEWWETTSDSQNLTVALGSPEPADPLDGSPKGTVFTSLGSEPQLQRPARRVDFESIGLDLDAIGQPSEQEHGRRSKHREPILLDVGRSRIVTQGVQHRVGQRPDQQALLGKARHVFA